MSEITFDKVYEDNFKYIYNFIYMRVLHRETAEDLTSETFMNALKNFDRYDESIASVRTWLCSIAIHAIQMLRRKASTGREIATDVIPEQMGDDISDTSLYDINREAERILSNLNEDERMLLSMRLAADFSFKEIAGILNISEKAAAERYRRIVIKCRKFTTGRSIHDFI